MRVQFKQIVFVFYLCFPGAFAAEFTQEQAALIYHWLANTNETPIHQLRGATDNQLYLHKNGKYEAVYDGEGKLVKDGINDGSYNYAHPIKAPLKHFNRDILPWILWGHTPEDPTSVEERVHAYSFALGSGLSVASAKERSALVGERAASEDEVIAFFTEVIRLGEIPEVYQILSISGYVPDEPFKIGEGLTRGLLAVIKSGKYQPVRPEERKE